LRKNFYDPYPKPISTIPKINSSQAYPSLRPVSSKAIQGCCRFFPRRVKASSNVFQGYPNLPKAIQGNFRNKRLFIYGLADLSPKGDGGNLAKAGWSPACQILAETCQKPAVSSLFKAKKFHRRFRLF
jgi:hypothetical protein